MSVIGAGLAIDKSDQCEVLVTETETETEAELDLRWTGLGRFSGDENLFTNDRQDLDEKRDGRSIDGRSIRLPWFSCALRWPMRAQRQRKTRTKRLGGKTLELTDVDKTKSRNGFIWVL